VSFCDFELSSAFFVCRFLCHLLSLLPFLLLDDLLEIFFGFWSSSCASWVMDLKFKLCAFYCQCNHQEGD
jgi:hypothetical protein